MPFFNHSAAAQKVTVVGSALRYCLRFLTPATIFFALLTLVLWCGGVQRLPIPYSAHPAGNFRSYIAVEEAANLTVELAFIVQLMCIVATLTTFDDRVREQRPVYWHFVAALLVPLGYFIVVPAWH